MSRPLTYAQLNAQNFNLSDAEVGAVVRTCNNKKRESVSGVHSRMLRLKDANARIYEWQKNPSSFTPAVKRCLAEQLSSLGNRDFCVFLKRVGLAGCSSSSLEFGDNHLDSPAPDLEENDEGAACAPFTLSFHHAAYPVSSPTSSGYSSPADQPDDTWNRNVRKTNVKTPYTFLEILRHWGSENAASLESLTELLRLMKHYDVRLTGMEYRKWPLTGKTLLKTDNTKFAKVLIRDFNNYDFTAHEFTQCPEMYDPQKFSSSMLFPGGHRDILAEDVSSEFSDTPLTDANNATDRASVDVTNVMTTPDDLTDSLPGCSSKVVEGKRVGSEQVASSPCVEAAGNRSDVELSDNEDVGGDDPGREYDADEEFASDDERDATPDEEDFIANIPGPRGEKLMTDVADDVKRKKLSKLGYFGIRNALFGVSCGLLDREGHIRNIRLIADIDPHALSDKLLQALLPADCAAQYCGNSTRPSARGTCPTFMIDIFIDGCEVFRNSVSGSATPILGRVIAIDQHFVPSRKSKPFVIGVYHGEGMKPALEPFMLDLIRELNNLHPSVPVTCTGEPKDLHVVVRALICDSVGRFWVKCTMSNAGYFCCERCVLRGALLVDPETGKSVPGSIRFLCTGDEIERTPDKWHTYLNECDQRDFDKKGNLVKRFHRRIGTPLDAIVGFNPISNMPLEEMHVNDGGAISATIEILFDFKDNIEEPGPPKKSGRPKSDGPKKKKKKANPRGNKKKTLSSKVAKRKSTHLPKKIRKQRANLRPTIVESENESRRRGVPSGDGPQKKRRKKDPGSDPPPTPKDKHDMNTLMRRWAVFTPYIFSRRCRPLSCMNKYKMNESRQFLYYYAIPLAFMSKSLTKARRRDLLIYIKGMLLITGNSHSPVDIADIAESDRLLSEFVMNMQRRNRSWATYRCHSVKHLPRDAYMFKCRLGSLSAYPFENIMRMFKKLGTRSGKHVVQQIVNRLMALKHYRLPTKSNGWEIDSEDSNYQEELERVRANGNKTDLPPLFVKNYNPFKKVVECESFKVSLKYPNNLVRLPMFDKPTADRQASFGAITNFYENDITGDLMIECGLFKKVVLTFKEPYPSSDINNFRIIGGHHPTRRAHYKFSEILGTVFPFHTLFQYENRKSVDTSNPEQEWIFQQIHL